jgi:hypothetical protein
MMIIGCDFHPSFQQTAAAATSAGSRAVNSASIRTVPVNQSAGPLPEGCVPILLISTCNLL